MTAPSPDTPCAQLWWLPGGTPRSTTPVAARHRIARDPDAVKVSPTTNEPSADTPHDRVEKLPGSEPMLRQPVASVQRWSLPTTVLPSAEIANALLVEWPGAKPNAWNVACRAETSGAPAETPSTAK